MDVTSKSLLERVRSTEDDTSWTRLVRLYSPLIAKWLRTYSAPQQDIDDLVQEVLAVVIKDIPRFSHAGNVGSFRSWLRTIVANRMRSFWRAGRCRPIATGNDDMLKVIEQIEDAESDLTRQWNEQHDRHILTTLLELMESEFQPVTVQAFRKVTLDGESADSVAKELGITVAAVYIAKSRVLRRLRDEASGLIDDESTDLDR